MRIIPKYWGNPSSINGIATSQDATLNVQWNIYSWEITSNMFRGQKCFHQAWYQHRVRTNNIINNKNNNDIYAVIRVLVPSEPPKSEENKPPSSKPVGNHHRYSKASKVDKCQWNPLLHQCYSRCQLHSQTSLKSQSLFLFSFRLSSLILLRRFKVIMGFAEESVFQRANQLIKGKRRCSNICVARLRIKRPSTSCQQTIWNRSTDHDN